MFFWTAGLGKLLQQARIMLHKGGAHSTGVHPTHLNLSHFHAPLSLVNTANQTKTNSNQQKNDHPLGFMLKNETQKLKIANAEPFEFVQVF